MEARDGGDPPESDEVEPVLASDPLDEPSPAIYPIGVLLWAFVGLLILTTVPPEARGASVGIVLFLLPLGMAVLAAFTNLFTRPERPPRVRRTARTLTFACLWPFVAWGQWDAKGRERRRERER